MTGTKLRAYRFTLDPTSAQLELLAQHAGAARWAYNYALAVKEQAWCRRQGAVDELVTLGLSEPQARREVSTKVPNYVGVAALWREQRDQVAAGPRVSSPWWRSVSSYAISSGFRAADAAWQAYFDSLSGKRAGRPVGRPRFKRKGRAKDSFSIYHDVKKPTIRVDTYRRLLIPRLGSVRVHDSAKRLAKSVARGGVVKSVTISRGAHRWYASVLVDEPTPAVRTTRAQQAAGAVGVDVGVTQLVALSTGELTANLRRGQAARRRLEKASRAYSRTQKGSNRRAKAAARLARIHHETAVRRRGDLHQVTKRLATRFEHVAVEDLNVAGMTRRPSPVPDPDHEGVFLPNRAAAKAGLNRALADSALGELRRQLAYKTCWYGSRLSAANPAYTSQTCSSCGHVARENRQSQAVFVCVECGHSENADVNAAKNVLARVLAAEEAESLNARGGRASPAGQAGEAGRPTRRSATGPGVIRASPTAA